MRLSQEAIQRMISGRSGGGAGGGGSFDSSALAGMASQAWVEEGYISKTFWNELFIIHKKVTTVVMDGDTEISRTVTTNSIFAPNEIPGTTTETDEDTGYVTTVTTEISSIESKKGFWTNYFLSALGLNGEGGGGGGTDLNEPLASINDAGLGVPTAAGQVLTWNGSQWVYNIPGGGGSAEELTNKTVTASTLDGLAGSFTFQGDNLISSSVDYVGMQIGSSVDKFQIACQAGSLMIRQNDNGGTSTSGWTDWTMMLTASNYANYITGFVTLDTAQTISGTKTFSNTVHLNAISEPSAGNGLLVYKPASGWSGISSTQWGVGSIDSQGVIRSSNTNLIHYKGGTSYKIWDESNDGAGSGLDADLLDGHHAADFALATWVSTNYLTKTDANNTYLSIEFFRALFRAYTSGGSEVVPNGGSTSTIDNIKAMFGFWTQQYISALGQNSGGGGGGTDLNEPLASINVAELGVPTAAGQVLTWNGSQWVYNIPGGGGGGGTGTVTSITAGTGLSGGTITTMGTIAIDSTYQGYIQHGETAYGWGNHASAGYATPNSVATQMQNYAYISNGAIHIGNNSITPLTSHQSVDGTFWGRSWSNHGTVSGSIEAGNSGGYIGGFDHIDLNTHASLYGYGGYIDFYYNGANSYTSRIIEEESGVLSIKAPNVAGLLVGGYNGDYVQIGQIRIVYDYSNNALKVMHSNGGAANLYALGGISALGISSSSSGSVSSSLIPGSSGEYDLGSTSYKWRNLYLYNGGAFSIVPNSSTINFQSNKKISINSDVELVDETNLYVDNRICIGSNNSSYAFYVSGNSYLTGSISASNVINRSDMRIKDFVENMDLSVDAIAKAPSFKFTFKDGDSRLRVGTSAQYWRGALPESVFSDADGMLGLDYGVTALVSVISVARKVMTHEERIAALEAENERLRNEIEMLKAA